MDNAVDIIEASVREIARTRRVDAEWASREPREE